MNNEDTQLEEFEVFWRDHYNWLKDRGYLLRPRYRPGWVASWIGTNADYWACEDYYTPFALDQFVMDATRIQDGKAVMLRRPDPPSMSDELKIGRLLCSPSAQSEPRNHCVPIFETLQISETESLDYPDRNLVVVMPYLVRWDRPDFSTVGEVVDFCSQIFEGLDFMHNLNIAHNDSKDTNIMMDWSPIYDVPPHAVATSHKADWSGPAKPYNRTTHPVKYYLIDWNLSRQYDPELGTPLQNPGYGGDQTVPEFKRKELCNPFAVDVYCLGNVIRRKFFDGTQWGPPRRNVEFLSDLISDMTHDDPTKRPTMKQVVTRFEEIRKGLSWWKLRSRVSNKRIPLIFHLLYSPIHWTVQLFRIIRRIPAIPDYTAHKQ
ncbi:hypothetical protein BT96DRAFT_928625 [Gymnopus androsaceus JB14]|uniref:Protein kinase domain-containing protein n=1 Tax=Gymnopus androsaceus JB14 TaxID=1447944 RepID=A0A6A4GK61_9AGAR|nr:hypothetical protein BT96DRAFT_928625 [Gymnopus androsaceus JB14]